MLDKVIEKLFISFRDVNRMVDPTEHFVANDYKGETSKLKQVFAKRRLRRRVATTNVRDFDGSRRALSLLPAPMAGNDKQVVRTNSIAFHQLLIKIEGNQCSGCIQVFSQKNKSRSGILVFRGRALGCVYGQRNLGYQVFGQEALDKALSDMAGFDNQVLAYQLPEEIVLAAASLFQGQAVDLPEGNSLEDTYNAALQSLMMAQSPGCVIIGDDDTDTINVAYVANGQAIGLYSNTDGWLDTTMLRSLLKNEKFQKAAITATVLAASNASEAYRLGLSLTGLGENRFTHPKDDEEAAQKRIEQRKATSKAAQKTNFQEQLASARAQVPGRNNEQTGAQGQYSDMHGSGGQINHSRHAHSINP